MKATFPFTAAFRTHAGRLLDERGDELGLGERQLIVPLQQDRRRTHTLFDCSNACLLLQSRSQLDEDHGKEHDSQSDQDQEYHTKNLEHLSCLGTVNGAESVTWNILGMLRRSVLTVVTLLISRQWRRRRLNPIAIVAHLRGENGRSGNVRRSGLLHFTELVLYSTITPKGLNHWRRP